MSTAQMLMAYGVAGSPPPPGLPLDSYTTNLFSAGGVERLLTSYTSNLLRVRRSSDDTEANIGYDGSNVLDATALLSFTGSANAYAGYGNVGVYMPITGTTGSTTFRDVKGHPCAAAANAQVSTALGFPAALFDGSGDRIDVTLSQSIQIGAGDFKVRCKIHPLGLGVKVIAEIYSGSNPTSVFFLQLNNGSGQIGAGAYSGGSIVGTCNSANGVIATGTTYDIEFGRSGSTFQLSVDGVSVATATSSAALNVGTRLEIGGDLVDGAVFTFNGYIWGFSLEPGNACHTGSFTPDALYGTGGDGFVTKVYDQSGGGFDFVQTDMSAQPKIVSNASALTSITEDGVDDFLATTSNSGTPTAITDFIYGNQRQATIASIGWNLLQLTGAVGPAHACYLQVQNVSAISWGVTDGSGNNYTAVGPSDSNFSTLGVTAGLYDKSASTTAKRRAFYAGSEITPSSSGANGTVGTGAFDAALWYLGGLPNDVASCGPLNFRNFAIYQGARSTADIAAISTALAI